MKGLIVEAVLLPCLLLLVSISSLHVVQASKEENKKLFEDLKKIDTCVLQTVYGFLGDLAPVPTTAKELESSCKTQSAAFKCVKEGSKNSPQIIRRGVVSLVNNMQRMTKKYCINPNSGISKKYVSDLKCVKDNHLAAYQAMEIEFGNSMYEIRRQNHTDPALELKYICCTLFKGRKKFLEGYKKCPNSKSTMEELDSTILSKDVTLLCDDEEDLMKNVCPKLKPMRLAKTLDPMSKTIGTSGMALYLVATLGEPE